MWIGNQKLLPMHQSYYDVEPTVAEQLKVYKGQPCIRNMRFLGVFSSGFWNYIDEQGRERHLGGVASMYRMAKTNLITWQSLRFKSGKVILLPIYDNRKTFFKFDELGK